MIKKETKDKVIIGVQVFALLGGAFAGAATIGGLTSVMPSGVTGFKKVATKFGIAMAGAGVEYATTKALTESGINMVALMDSICDKIIECKKKKSETEEVKEEDIKEEKEQ